MDHSPVLEDLRTLVDTLQARKADADLVRLGQQVLAVLDGMEARLDDLDDREGA